MTSNSQEKYIDKVIKRYSKLFGLPSQNRLLLYLGILTLHGGVLSIFPLNFSFENFVIGLGFGGVLFFLTVISDLFLNYTSMKSDPIFNLRRCLALSFFSSIIWYGVLLLGLLITIFFGASVLWIRFIFLGFSGSLILRLLVLTVVSFARIDYVLFSSIFQPILVLGIFYYVGSIFGFITHMSFIPLFWFLDVKTLFYLVVIAIPVLVIIAGVVLYVKRTK